MYRFRYIIITLLSFTLILNASCSKETVKSLSDLSKLRSELIKEYKANDINVTVQNSNVLGISFINSAFNNLDEQEREKKAREIALFAKDHYPSINSIDKIWVSFVIYKNYIVFQYSNGLATYFFDKRSLASAAPDREASRGVIAASYNPKSNETTVYLNSNLQVYSEGGSSIMLFPHFTLPGDNFSAPRLIKPKVVVLDFSTNSRKRMFTDNPKLIIYVAGQKIFSGMARTTNVLGGEGEQSVNEFLSQEISYDQFVQLTSGEQVKITVGTKELKLTSSHVAELRAMKRCVEELRCE